MTDAEKLSLLKTLLFGSDTDTTKDRELTAYLTVAKNEILNWMYRAYAVVPETQTNIPSKYNMVQINAVIAGYNLKGAENQTSHSENGISRSFRYSDMVDYIHNNVACLVRVGG